MSSSSAFNGDQLLPSSHPKNPKSVHRSWPTGQAARIRKCFSNLKSGRQAAVDFNDSLRSIGVHTVAHYPKHSRRHVAHKLVLLRLILPFVWKGRRRNFRKSWTESSEPDYFLKICSKTPPIYAWWGLAMCCLPAVCEAELFGTKPTPCIGQPREGWLPGSCNFCCTSAHWRPGR